MNRTKQSLINIISSLLGYGIPMLVSLVTTPIVLRELGVSAYGLVSLVGVITGYLTVMDMGLDLPITKYLAEDHAKRDTHSANLILNNTSNVFAPWNYRYGSIFSTARLITTHLFEVPEELIDEAIIVFKLAGIGFLGSVVTSWGRAIFMGIQRFEITYGIAIITNLFGIGLG